MTVGGEVSQGASFQEPSQHRVVYYDGFYVLGEVGWFRMGNPGTESGTVVGGWTSHQPTKATLSVLLSVLCAGRGSREKAS